MAKRRRKQKSKPGKNLEDLMARDAVLLAGIDSLVGVTDKGPVFGSESGGSPGIDPEPVSPGVPPPVAEPAAEVVPPSVDKAVKAAKKPKGGKWGKVAAGVGKWGWIPLMALEGAGYVKKAAKEAFGVGEKFFDGKSALDEFLGQKRQEQAYNEHQQKRMQALQQLKVQNRMRLMQVAPHLAQSLLAGRELPEDGVVIGGTPRVDLLDQVAEGMSSGMFQQQGM